MFLVGMPSWFANYCAIDYDLNEGNSRDWKAIVIYIEFRRPIFSLKTFCFGEIMYPSQFYTKVPSLFKPIT